LQVVEPSLRRLSVRVIGDTAVIQGDVGLGELMPLQFMGDGMVRLLSMVLGILTLPPGGIALVDEVENGIHHSAMLKVWLALATAARKASVQIFATTHSHECIEAAHRAFEESGKYDLRVHRLERVAGQVRAVTSDQTTLATALDQEWEVR
jgi:AAA15 family ATPase/GTPase